MIFLTISKENKPWFLAEIKFSSKQSLSDNLRFFQEQLNAPYAFPLAFDMSIHRHEFI